MPNVIELYSAKVPKHAVKHGILTTRASYWAHLFPESLDVFWYSVADMREWLDDWKPDVTEARSANGVVTGWGHCIPKTAPFIRNAKVPDPMIECFDWSGSDKQRGLAGEQVITWLARRGIIQISPFEIRRVTEQREQIDFGDLCYSWRPSPYLEGKTEGRAYAGSWPNLFVQTHERGHQHDGVR